MTSGERRQPDDPNGEERLHSDRGPVLRSDLAILRTTPALLGLFSLVTLVAHARLLGHAPPVRQAAWYAKPLPTFVDALALVRRELWAVPVFSLSPETTDVIEIPRSRWDRMTTALGYAA